MAQYCTPSRTMRTKKLPTKIDVSEEHESQADDDLETAEVEDAPGQ